MSIIIYPTPFMSSCCCQIHNNISSQCNPQWNPLVCHYILTLSLIMSSEDWTSSRRLPRDSNCSQSGHVASGGGGDSQYMAFIQCNSKLVVVISMSSQLLIFGSNSTVLATSASKQTFLINSGDDGAACQIYLTICFQTQDTILVPHNASSAYL